MTQSKKQAPVRRKKESKLPLIFLLVAVIIFICSLFYAVSNGKDKNQQTDITETTIQTTEAITKNENAGDTTKENAESTTESATESTTEAQTESVTAAAVEKPGTIAQPTIITINPDTWFLTLVNSGYRIPEDYEPDLVYVCGSGERLDRRVAEHYEEMYNAAQKEGINLVPCSGYRSYELQEKNYNNKISFFESQGYPHEDAVVKAATIIMPPGSSEHNLGYAMDIVCVDEWFEDTAEFKWLTEHAADYGFIMRYPKDKTDITGVIYEPWHWRYVGVENAQTIKESGLVLEEYLEVAQ